MKTEPTKTKPVFAIRYGWRSAGRMYFARTVWQGTNSRAALDDFLRRHRHVLTAQIVPESL